jgi:NAD(P)-dependent dehydrogenase (short-subunit alcohol dehydrogenase family)
MPAPAADELATQIRTSFAGIQPIQRSGEALDVAKAVLWLASDDSAFINGHALVVDGGLTVGRSWSGMQQYFGELLKLAPQMAPEKAI